MTGVDDLLTWLRAIWDARERELDEDERWARAASQRYPHATEGAVPEHGVHWRWVAGDNWDTVTVDPVIDEFVAEPGYTCNLATVEEWPAGNRPMPRTYAHTIVEMDSSAAGHIARWDPARVLREVATERAEIAAKRAILDRVEYELGTYAGSSTQLALAYLVLKQFAQPYAGRDGWREEWRS